MLEDGLLKYYDGQVCAPGISCHQTNKLTYFLLRVHQNAEAVFSELDADLSGYLDHDEVAQLCKKLGKKVSSINPHGHLAI